VQCLGPTPTLIRACLWMYAIHVCDCQGARYYAVYNYDANDDDEVSIVENDSIANVEILDEGWVMGTVERTGLRGMIPSNYIEECN